ncbi:hypothetical protein D3C72_2253540 [compost metagenome]
MFAACARFITDSKRSRLSAMLALMFLWLNASLAAPNTAISRTPASSAASSPLSLGTSTG